LGVCVDVRDPIAIYLNSKDVEYVGSISERKRSRKTTTGRTGISYRDTVALHH
jgi:hypothetical protein